MSNHHVKSPWWERHSLFTWFAIKPEKHHFYQSVWTQMSHFRVKHLHIWAVVQRQDHKSQQYGTHTSLRWMGGTFLGGYTLGLSLPTAKVNSCSESLSWIRFVWSKALHRDREKQVNHPFRTAHTEKQRFPADLVQHQYLSYHILRYFLMYHFMALQHLLRCNCTFASWTSTNIVETIKNEPMWHWKHFPWYIFEDLLMSSASLLSLRGESFCSPPRTGSGNEANYRAANIGGAMEQKLLMPPTETWPWWQQMCSKNNTLDEVCTERHRRFACSHDGSSILIWE